MKIIKNKYIPLKGYKYCMLFGYLFTRTDDFELEWYEYVHEYDCHVQQMKETGYIGFYLIYGIEALIKSILWLFNKRIDIYRSLSAEQEAYNNHFNPNYKNERKRYKWLKNIFKIVIK